MPRLSSALDAWSSTMNDSLLGSFLALDLLDRCFSPDFQGSESRHGEFRGLPPVVEATGLEPVTFALQTQCSSN